MHLIVGASGRLGRAVTARLLAAGDRVRALSRNPAAVQWPAGVEPVAGDLLDAASLQRACAGCRTVLAGAHAFTGTGRWQPEAVDDAGNRALIAAAQGAGVQRFVLMSAATAGPDHPVDMFRAKHAAEVALRRSGLAHTILRPAAFMEAWAEILGAPMRAGKASPVFGRGDNPINFVAVDDVADWAVAALRGEPALDGRRIELGGPQNLTLHDLLDQLERAAGRSGAKRQPVPLPALRALAVLLRPFHRGLARQMAAGAWMAGFDLRLPPGGSEDGRALAWADAPPPRTLAQVLHAVSSGS